MRCGFSGMYYIHYLREKSLYKTRTISFSARLYVDLFGFKQQNYFASSRITRYFFLVILKPHYSFLKPPSQFNFVEPLHAIYLLPEFWCTLFGSCNFTGTDFIFPLFLKGFAEHPYCKTEIRQWRIQNPVKPLRWRVLQR